MYKLFGKRLFDILASIILLIVLSPFFVLVPLLVLLIHGKPILFKQTRPGLHEAPFDMYKFRTMTNKKNHQGSYLSDEERLTTFGKVLRSTSLDELPELINVLKGDMSLIGPRPLLMEYLPLYNTEQKQRHDVKPGITGLAQVNGRNAISWSKKFEYDLFYVHNVTLLLDIKIIFLTILAVIKRTGINSDNHVSAEPFRGNPSNNE